LSILSYAIRLKYLHKQIRDLRSYIFVCYLSMLWASICVHC
jgi:hypothetical protein